MAHVLYRFYSATGQLLYVGITMNPPQRFKSHRDSKDWWHEVAGISIETYSSREDLANAERRAIQVERPMHNIVHAKPASPTHEFVDEADEPPTPDVSLSDLFSRLSGPAGPSWRDEWKERQRARCRAIDECSLCDRVGYRGRSVCAHDAVSAAWVVTSEWEAQRDAEEQMYAELRRQHLQVIQGGAQ